METTWELCNIARAFLESLMVQDARVLRRISAATWL